jgi:hypothetical protein
MDKIRAARATVAVEWTIRLSTLLGLAISLSACDSRTSVSPSPPPASVIRPSSVTYTLSGVVFEITAAGRVPVEGVELYCDSCGSPDGHTSVYTDAGGFYSLEWTPNGVHPLFVRKAGYDIFDANGTQDGIGRISATVRGHTTFDVQLVRRSPAP